MRRPSTSACGPAGASVISIAHRPAVLAHHTHVLVLTGDGGWSLHPAEGFQFDEG